ncbi:hypothetical protein B0H10DRAFT_2023991 [Mycena sp. CBHHK59/15]|nr:hypothetical protein B0H10DRAFT_2023991 [Mycena sp. CBHHK59/15]
MLRSTVSFIPTTMSEAQYSVTAPTITCSNEDPFNNDIADIIVRSSTSHVDFRVNKTFLAVASPVFKDMLSLPQADSEAHLSDIHIKEGLHIVPFEEEAETLAALLKLCYPGWMLLDCKPLFPTVERVLALLTAARKYAMDGIERQLGTQLVDTRFLESQPLRIFALAMKHELHAEARVCAKQTLKVPLLGRDYIPELEQITAGAYHRLQDYHIKCGLVAHDVANNVKWITRDNWVWFECSSCRWNVPVVISGERRKFVARWWAEYMVEAGNGLKECPSGTTIAIDSKAADIALAKASGCSTCGPRAFAEMREFCRVFADQVAKATEEVSFRSLRPGTCTCTRIDGSFRSFKVEMKISCH